MPAKSRNNVSGPQLARAVGGRKSNHQHTHAPANPFAHFPPPPANKQDGIPLPPAPRDKRDGLPLPPFHAAPHPPHFDILAGPAAFGPPLYALPQSAHNDQQPPPPPPSHSLNHGSKHRAAGKPRTGSQAGTGFSKQGHPKAKPHYNKRNGPPPPFAQSFDSTSSDDSIIFYDHPPAPPKPAPKKAVLHGPPAARRQSSFSSASASSASASSFASGLTDSTMLEEQIHISGDMNYLVKNSTKRSPRTGISTTVEVEPLLPGKIHHTVSRLTPKAKANRGPF